MTLFLLQGHCISTSTTALPRSSPSDPSKISGLTGEMGTVVTGRAVFARVDVSGKVILFGEQETDSSRRIRFSGEADESTLSWNFFFTVGPAL